MNKENTKQHSVIAILIAGGLLLLSIFSIAIYHLNARQNESKPAASSVIKPDKTNTAISENIIRVYTSPENVKSVYKNNIAKAVSEASPGDTIAIGAGTYIFTQTLYPPANVNIIGAGADKTILQYHGCDVAIIADSGFIMFQKLQIITTKAQQVINCDGHPILLLECLIDNKTGGLALYAEGCKITAISCEIIGGIDVSNMGIFKTKQTKYNQLKTVGTVKKTSNIPIVGMQLENWTFSNEKDDSWQTASYWSITNGSAIWNCPEPGKDGTLAQNINISIGKRYSLIWKISNSSGSFFERTLQVGGLSLDFTKTENGIFARKFTATTSESIKIYIENGNIAPSKMILDFIYLQEIDDTRPDQTLTADKVLLLDNK